MNELARYTSALHRLTIPPSERAAFRNGAMRKLNHEHIFDIPLRTDGALSEMLERVTPGLDRFGDGLRRDRRFREAVEKLDAAILSTRDRASFTATCFLEVCFKCGPGQLRVIDPEFSFCGDPEFDIGVFYAHLLLSRHDDGTHRSGCRRHLEDTRTPSLSSFNSPAWKSCAAFSEWPNCLLLLAGNQAASPGTKPRNGFSQRQGQANETASGIGILNCCYLSLDSSFCRGGRVRASVSSAS